MAAVKWNTTSIPQDLGACDLMWPKIHIAILSDYKPDIDDGGRTMRPYHLSSDHATAGLGSLHPNSVGDAAPGTRLHSVVGCGSIATASECRWSLCGSSCERTDRN